MKKVNLGEVTEIIAGQSPPSSSYNNNGVGLPFFQGKADFGEIYPVTRSWCDSPNKIARKNDILISVRAPVGPTNLCFEKACIGRGLSAIRSNEKTYYKYVFRYLRFIEPKFSGKARGSTFSSITQNDLKDIDIPLPPISEQKRIAAILDKADELRQKRRESLNLCDEYLRSVFLDMFGDPVTNPKGWEVKEFSNIGHISRNSIEPNKFKNYQYYIGLEHIESETGKILEKVPIKMINLKSSKFSFKKNSVLYGKLRPYLNKVALPDFNGICSTDIIPIEPINNYSNKYFIAYLMRHRSFVSMANERTSGANLPRISPAALSDFELIRPDIHLQNKFAEIVIKTETIKAKMQAQLDEAENLFSSLMQRAFRGEL